MKFFSKDNLEEARAYIGSMGWFGDDEVNFLAFLHSLPSDAVPVTRLEEVRSSDFSYPFITESKGYNLFSPYIKYMAEKPLIFGPDDSEKALPYIGKLGWFAESRETLMTRIGQPDNRSILMAVSEEGTTYQNKAGWKWDYFSPDMVIEPKIYSGVDAEDATPWIGKEGWVGDNVQDVKEKKIKVSLLNIAPEDIKHRFSCKGKGWIYFQPILEEEYRACRSLPELKSIMGRKIMRETANGTVIKTIDEVYIENGKCYINQSTALNIFLHWVFDDTGKPVGVKE